MPKRGQPIVDDYLRRIVSGELTEGELLPTETAMIEHYQVSRTAVRESVQTLAHKGFVKIRQGSGSTVAPRYMWNLLDPDYMALTGGSDSLPNDIIEVSDVVEPAASALAATRATEDQIRSLHQLVAAMSQAADTATLADLDLEFHRAIGECTGNRVLQSVLNSLLTLGKGSTTVNDGPDVAHIAPWTEHVVDAITTRDPEAARDAMRTHIRKLHRA